MQVLNQLLDGDWRLSVSYMVLIGSALMYIVGYMRSETAVALVRSRWIRRPFRSALPHYSHKLMPYMTV